MSLHSERQALHDPATRGHDGRRLSPVEPPTVDQAPSPAWLAQLGRAPTGEYAHGREVVKRLTEDGLGVPGDDPLYQYLGANRLFVEVLKAQHEEHKAYLRSMLEEARQGAARLLADVGAAGEAAAAARRAQDDAAMRQFAAELELRTADAVHKLQQAMAEEREALTAAMAMTLAEALAQGLGEKAVRRARGRAWRPFGGLGPALAARGRSAAVWAALLAMSVLAGLALLWAAAKLAPAHGGP